LHLDEGGLGFVCRSIADWEFMSSFHIHDIQQVGIIKREKGETKKWAFLAYNRSWLVHHRSSSFPRGNMHNLWCFWPAHIFRFWEFPLLSDTPTLTAVVKIRLGRIRYELGLLIFILCLRGMSMAEREVLALALVATMSSININGALAYQSWRLIPYFLQCTALHETTGLRPSLQPQ
jgi:hypothetical protein